MNKELRELLIVFAAATMTRTGIDAMISIHRHRAGKAHPVYAKRCKLCQVLLEAKEEIEAKYLDG